MNKGGMVSYTVELSAGYSGYCCAAQSSAWVLARIVGAVVSILVLLHLLLVGMMRDRLPVKVITRDWIPRREEVLAEVHLRGALLPEAPLLTPRVSPPAHRWPAILVPGA